MTESMPAATQPHPVSSSPTPSPSPQGEGSSPPKRLHYWKPAEIYSREYPELPFEGKWETLVGRPSPEFRAIVYGPPKNGKSTFVLQFAKYLCGFGSVMYVSAEELIAKTFRDRMQRLDITEDDNICILAERKYANIKRAIKNWRPRFLIVDSAHRAHLSHSQLNALHEQHKRMASVVILQGTKDGNFKGDTAWEHDADIIIRLANGIAHQRGRFCADSQLRVFGSGQDLFTPHR